MNLSIEPKIDPSERFPHLARAPIVEAVIHWQARAKREWQPDQIEKELRARLPDYPDSKMLRDYRFEAKLETDGWAQSQSESWSGLGRTHSDQPYVAQFKRDGFIFSRLAPYENWETFSAEALRLWKVFVELAVPSEIERLGVRFINRVGPVTIEDLGKSGGIN